MRMPTSVEEADFLPCVWTGKHKGRQETDFAHVVSKHKNFISALTSWKNQCTSPDAFTPIRDFKFEYEFDSSCFFAYPRIILNGKLSMIADLKEQVFKDQLLRWTRVILRASHGNIDFSFPLQVVMYGHNTPVEVVFWAEKLWQINCSDKYFRYYFDTLLLEIAPNLSYLLYRKIYNETVKTIETTETANKIWEMI